MRELEEWARPLRSLVHLLSGVPADYDALIDAVGEERLVLLGEASHGTHEFYHESAEITKFQAPRTFSKSPELSKK